MAPLTDVGMRQQRLIHEGRLEWHLGPSKRQVFLPRPPLISPNTNLSRTIEKTLFCTLVSQQMNQYAHHLLIDGYIAMTFGPQDAEAYHCTVLRRESHVLRPYNLTEYPGIFFARPPHRPDLDPRQPQTPWVIDHMVWNQGTVIGQQIWATRNQYEFLCPPIFFVHRNGGLGLPLNQAAGGDCMSLRGASQPAPLGDTCSTHAQIRINWHGYFPWDEQILIRTQTPRREIIQLEKFVKHVAKKVKKFIVEGRRPMPYNNGQQRWFIGDGGITPDDVVLIGVVHVSQGSWMPILQLNRYLL